MNFHSDKYRDFFCFNQHQRQLKLKEIKGWEMSKHDIVICIFQLNKCSQKEVRGHGFKTACNNGIRCL